MCLIVNLLAAKSDHSGLPGKNFNSILATSTPLFARMNRAVFLDRDGTLIAEKNYLHRPEDVEIFPGTGAALKKLSAAGFKLVVVTNQSGIGRGYFTLADAERVNERVSSELARDGVRFEKTYIAPEAPDQPSRGRKPSPQFLFDARDEFNLNLAECFMVGDKLIDLECGWNAGVKKSILVRTGYGAELERLEPEKIFNAVVADDLRGAAEWILNAD
jgi:D-glycero-D-manno-heptose 1,7-bisphosphate phosphatase